MTRNDTAVHILAGLVANPKFADGRLGTIVETVEMAVQLTDELHRQLTPTAEALAKANLLREYLSKDIRKL